MENVQNNQLTFQQAMTRLDQIVDALNNPNLELEQAMQLFKEGLALSRQCEDQLKHFENEMNQLIRAENRTDLAA